MIVVLTIAGSDPTGGAGIQADLKTFFALGVYGASAITAVTAQNSRGVQSVHIVPAASLAQQMEAVFEEFDVAAIKTGMLPDEAAVCAVSEVLSRRGFIPLIVDPVIRASAGQALVSDGAVAAMRRALFPRAALVTPNLDEAALLAEMSIGSVDDMRAAARRIAAAGAHAVLVKGGHAAFAPATDVLFDGAEFHDYRGAYLEGYAVHGAGCSFASAIAAHIALGATMREAVGRAKEFVARGIAAAPDIGAGRRPLRHAPV